MLNAVGVARVTPGKYPQALTDLLPKDMGNANGQIGPRHWRDMSHE
jgi:hypothetical protein